jgi:hypothetical protein
LRKPEGEYLILRKLRSETRIIVGYLRIKNDAEFRYPARFVTESQLFFGSRDAHDRVEGICYDPQDQDNTIFTLGKAPTSSQIRSAILQPILKPGLPHPECTHRDLVGIRLGLGRPDPEIVGYRIWCSRLGKKTPRHGWRYYAREYDFVDDRVPVLKPDDDFCDVIGVQPDAFFNKHVVGFRHVLKWLNHQSVAALHDLGDP